MRDRTSSESVTDRLVAVLMGLVRRVERLVATAKHWVGRGLDRGTESIGSIWRPLRPLLFGRDAVLSAAVSVAGLVSVPVVGATVARAVGYPGLERALWTTWTGTDPLWSLFVAGGLLVVLGAASAGVNSGFVPTALLVSGPVFGLALTRYGTATTDPIFTQPVVSLPEATVFATMAAVVCGVPLATVGFVLGEVGRRALGSHSVALDRLTA